MLLKEPTIHGTVCTTKNEPAQNVNSTTFEELWLKVTPIRSSMMKRKTVGFANSRDLALRVKVLPYQLYDHGQVS